jgi:hypothetical protein
MVTMTILVAGSLLAGVGCWLWLRGGIWKDQPARLRVCPADWGEGLVKEGGRRAYCWYDEEGRRRMETDPHLAVDHAHVVSIVRGDWPRAVEVFEIYTFGNGSTRERRIYGLCEVCGQNAWRDADDRCMPCHAAALISACPKRRIELAKMYCEMADRERRARLSVDIPRIECCCADCRQLLKEVPDERAEPASVEAKIALSISADEESV